MNIVVLDATPTGILSNPNRTPTVVARSRWLTRMISSGWRIIVPEIVDFEIRRELLMRQNQQSINKLDDLIARTEYYPLSTPIMKYAAQLWAFARQAGLPTASNSSLDSDVILAARLSALAETSSSPPATSPI